jgi:tRNA pseudouridine55 synthase
MLWNVAALRRLAAGQFSIADAKTIEELAAMDEQHLQDCLIAVDEPLSVLPAINLSVEEARSIRYGQVINFQPISVGSVRLYQDAAFLGLGEMSLDGKIAPKKLFNLNNEQP